MIFTSVEECTACRDQINLNKGYTPPQTIDNVHEWFNVNHLDYIEGGRASIMKPTGGGTPSRWLVNLENYTWIEKEENPDWYIKTFPPDEDPII